MTRAVVNAGLRPGAVPAPADLDAVLAFHRGLGGYAPTPLHSLDSVADSLGLGAVLLKDESDRLGLPAFKVLGAAWAVQRALRERPETTTLVAASAGNHGRAVAHVAAHRGLRARVFVPARSAAARRRAIEGEGAEVVVVDGTYEEACAVAARAAAEPGALELADVGGAGPASWVIDGYGTLFAEVAEQTAGLSLVVVPAGVGSLAAAAARFGAAHGVPVVAVEAANAACVAAALAAGEPTEVATPGTSMAGLDCAVVSETAWPTLRDGLAGAIAVTDAEAHAAMRELAALGLRIGDCGAAALAALRALATGGGAAAALRDAVGLRPATRGAGARVLLVATEGVTDPDAYAGVAGA